MEEVCSARLSLSVIPWRASLASPITLVTVSTFLSISLRSMSMWITLASLLNSSSLAVVLSDILAPTTRMTSASDISMFEAPVPCIPQSPEQRGWSLGIEPFPMSVVATGAIIRLASCMRFSDASAAMTPPPARMTGLLAFASSVAAQSISRGFGWGFRLYPLNSTLSGNTISSELTRQSLGRSTRTAPWRPVEAM